MLKCLAFCFLLLGPVVGRSGLASGAEAASRGRSGHTFVLWQLPNQTHSQMMSYVLQTARGQLIVLDGGTTGDAAYLKGFLAALGNTVEAWFISHAHDDHFGALSQLLGQHDGPRIHAIYGSLPTLEWIAARGYGAQDTKPYEQFLAALRKANKTVVELTPGQELTIDGLRLEVLGVQNPEITTNAINNSSLVLRASDRAKSVLFTSDLGVEGGRKLLASPLASRLPADYVQMAHHGQEGVEEAFYQAVKATGCLWPTPLWLWDNDSGKGRGSGPWKTLAVRGWMEKLGVQRNYVMTEGLIRIE
jgi:beta-lactamase superfamily II metal-dependent hydrolase